MVSDSNREEYFHSFGKITISYPLDEDRKPDNIWYVEVTLKKELEKDIGSRDKDGVYAFLNGIFRDERKRFCREEADTETKIGSDKVDGRFPAERRKGMDTAGRGMHGMQCVPAPFVLLDFGKEETKTIIKGEKSERKTQAKENGAKCQYSGKDDVKQI